MKSKLFICTILISFYSLAQVPKQVIIEHFTNTYCSICGNNNPALHANMANHPNVLRITYHPSSPYANCTLNQHNVSGNDDRTNQYGIYGATPRIVIQGDVQPAGGGNFSNPALFDNYSGEMSPLSIEIMTDTSDIDSISVSLTITVEDNIDLIHQNPILYVGLAEDTIYFNAPNGENIHHNVFRKELSGTMGTGISLNDVIGYQANFEFTVKRHSDWNIERMFAFATIQDSSTDEILQGGASNFTPDISLAVSEIMKDNYDYTFFNNQLNITLEDAKLFDNVVVFDLQGKILLSERIYNENIQLNLQNLHSSMYIVQLINSEIPASASFKIVK
jgi:hypothetical protein